MTEFADFLYKITPLILGVCAFFIAPAAERLKRSSSHPPVEVVQGQTVDLTGEQERLRALEHDLLQESEIWRLKNLLTKHGIDYEKKKEDGHGGESHPGVPE